MENLIDSLFENKKIAFIGCVFYIVIILVVIVMIWKPKSSTEKEVIKYEEYNQESTNKDMANYYFNKIVNSFDEVVENHMSEEYLEYTNKTIDNIKNEIKIDGTSIISGLNARQMGEYYVYSSKINYVGGSTQINVIEEYPYEYKVTFGTFVKYDQDSYSNLSNGIAVKRNSVYYDQEYLEFDITFTNEENEYVKFDFANAENIYITTNDGQKHYLSNNVLTSEDNTITKGGMLNRKFVFAIATSVQSNMNSLTFDNVSVDGEIKTIIISIN